MKQIGRYIVVALLCLHVSNMQSTTYGSYSTPSREAKPPALNDGDSLIGFAVFYQGFALSGSSVSVTWDCYYPVGGDISLNGGNLLLNEDFILNTDASFTPTGGNQNGGTITGNVYVVSLPDGVNQYDFQGTFTFIDTKLILNSPVALDGIFTFQGDCIIEGSCNVLTTTSAIIKIDAGSTLHIKDLTMQGISAGTIYCADTAGHLALDDVVWIQYGDYTFEQGSLAIYCTTQMKGPAVFSYTSSQATTIATKSSWLFDFGMTFSYASTPGTLIQFADSTSLMQLYETNLYSAVPGISFTKGTLALEGTCPLLSAATQVTDGVLLGDGTSAVNNITLKIGPESGFDVRSGYLVYKNV